jgi:hypothetical protein
MDQPTAFFTIVPGDVVLMARLLLKPEFQIWTSGVRIVRFSYAARNKPPTGEGSNVPTTGSLPV